MSTFAQDDLARIKESFEFFDKDKDSYLSQKELENTIISLGGDLGSKEKLIIKEIGGNNSKFSFDNLVYICQKLGINIQEMESKIIQALQVFELEKKGFVHMKNIVSLLSNDKIPEKEINQIIREANPDSNGFFNINEFAKEIIGNSIPDTSNQIVASSMNNTIE